MAKLRTILDGYHMDVLRAMVRYHGLQPRSKSKAAHVNELARFISRADTVNQTLQNLSTLERRVLAVIQAAKGEIHSGGLKQALLREGLIKATPEPSKSRWSSGYYRRYYEANPNYKGTPCYEDLIARLTLRGLVFSQGATQMGSSVRDWSPGEIVFIHPAVTKHLPDLASELGKAGQYTGEPSQVLAGSARAFQRDLGRIWRFIQSKGELRLTTQGYIYKADLKAISETLGVDVDLRPGRGEADNNRLYFIRRLLPDLKLVRENRQGHLEPVPESDFLELSPAERVKRTFEVWRDGSGWNELIHLPAQAIGYRHTNPAPPQIKSVRKKILAYVREMGTDGWVSIDHLIDMIRLRDYGFLFSRRRYDHYYTYYESLYGTPYYSANNPFGITWEGVKDDADGWEKVEGALIAHIIAGPLFWMGLTSLGYSDKDQPDRNNPTRPVAYRLTELGAWVLGLSGPVEIPEEGGRVVVQPNFQILAMEPVSDQVLINLDRFAEPRGGDRVMTYELSRQSVYQGQQNGWPVPKIMDYLEKISGMPLPGNIRRSLEDWQALHERIVFRRGVTLVQAADKEMLDRLMAEPESAGILGQRCTDTVALSTSTVKKVASVLRRQGWLPLITPSSQRQAPDSVRADPDGRLRFVHAAPSIYALGRVSPYSEWVDGTWKITPTTIQKALRPKGVTVDSILKDLQSVHAGPLPHELILKIKAWGKYYGDAVMATLTLAEFRDQKTLQELLADPELASYLQPFEAGHRALAVVDREHLDTVQHLLAERGVEIKWALER